MHISFVEIQNFRKLKSIHIDFAKETTLFVGANNSGKTSAIGALHRFLIKPKDFCITDFTLSNWGAIINIGKSWEESTTAPKFGSSPDPDWQKLLPSLDIWLQARPNEIHYISHLLPKLNWTNEPIGVRLRFEPRSLEDLYKDYKESHEASHSTMVTAQKLHAEKPYTVPLWPCNLQDFLAHRNRLQKHFTVKYYILNPSKILTVTNGVAAPQELPPDVEALENNPLSGLFQIDEIDAQRGFSNEESGNNVEEQKQVSRAHKLSDQLRGYYTKHISPSDAPDPADIDALEGIHQAQESFNKKLQEGFSSALSELETMGYPGLTDPKLSISTVIEPIDGLRHTSAVQYEVIPGDKEGMTRVIRLPEQSSGLGYQNLVSIIFRLISFRDSWMQVGKAGKRTDTLLQDSKPQPPLHLVLVEEPEAHLHAQVQQVFIRKAYDVLRKHANLGKNESFTTQLVVSTHSSYIVHECHFDSLRYFRRLPAETPREAPISVVVNLKDIFGTAGDTEKFETRYIRTTHCDLFFADAIILVEGSAERMLLPHFIREHFKEPLHTLHQRYISILEIGGSHAHRLKPLIETLAIPTLIITDLDSAKLLTDGKTYQKAPPKQNVGMVSLNDTLSLWLPKESDLDKLIDLPEESKKLSIDKHSSVRVAYQIPIMVNLPSTKKASTDAPTPSVKALSYTFEDALVLENLGIFNMTPGTGLVGKFHKSVNSATDVQTLVDSLHKALEDGDKAKFAIDLIFEISPSKLKIPTYIHKGLEWLEEELRKKDEKHSSPAQSAGSTTSTK